MNIETTVKSALGKVPVDLLLANCRIVNVFTGDIQTGSIAIADDTIVGIGEYEARSVRDLKGRYVAPGFIDAHVHIESSMASVTEFACRVVACGTTAVIADPHEIANVLGTAGIDYMLASAKGQPINIYYSLPSCVPATDLETSGARLSAADLEPYWRNGRVVALAEMMNFPGVLNGDPQVIAKLNAARANNKPVDGHAPGLAGKELCAYAAAGIHSDHECTTADEAAEKLRAGMHIMIREGTTAKNLTALLPVVTAQSGRQLMWCTDDRHPHELLKNGHIDDMLRLAIARGIEPVLALQMATINPARYFGLHHLGAIAPGRQADLVVFSDLDAIKAEMVYCRGQLTAQMGKLLPNVKKPGPVRVPRAMNLDPAKVDLRIRAEGDRIRIIDIVPDQVVTGQSIVAVRRIDGLAVADPDRDLSKIAVVERYSGSARVGMGFVRGLNLSEGALASSVAHDSHNIIVAGTNDEDMHTAIAEIVRMGGGLVVASHMRVQASLALPIAGLMSAEPLEEIDRRMGVLMASARAMGTRLHDPFMTLAFLALAVIPELKITDSGLIDVNRFEPVPLFVNPS